MSMVAAIQEAVWPKRRTKHIDVKHFFNWLIAIKLTYLRTDEMVVDILTKAANDAKLKKSYKILD